MITTITLSIIILKIVWLSRQLKLEKIQYDERTHRKVAIAYCNNVFGEKKYRIFTTDLDDEGAAYLIVYRSFAKWFQKPEYEWFRVYQKSGVYMHYREERH